MANDLLLLNASELIDDVKDCDYLIALRVFDQSGNIFLISQGDNLVGADFKSMISCETEISYSVVI